MAAMWKVRVGSVRGERRGRWRAPVSAAVLTACLVPFGFGRPAEAATASDVEDVSLTFVTFSGATVSCKLTGAASHDTEQHDGQVTSFATRSDGLVIPECKADHTIDVAYREEDGDTVQFRGAAFGTDQLELSLHSVKGNVRATHTVQFSECDGSRSTSCSLSVQTAAK